MKKVFGIFLAILFIVSCSSTKNIASDNKDMRISVLSHETSLKSDVEEFEISLPSPKENVSWMQTGGNSYHVMQHLKSAGKLKKVWSRRFGSANSNDLYLLASPVIYNKKIYTVDAKGKISCFSIDSGKKLWTRKVVSPNKFDQGLDNIGSGLAVSDGKLIVTTGYGEVMALNADNGTYLWSNDIKLPFRIAPTIGMDKVFVQTISNKLIALDLFTGRELWSHQTNSEDTMLIGGAAPAYDANLDVVIAAYSNGEIYAIKASNGTVLWFDSVVSYQSIELISEITSIKANPIIKDGIAYIISNSNLMLAIDVRTGTRVWEKEISSVNQPWFAGRYIFQVTNNSEILVLDAKNGDILWVASLPNWDDEENKKGEIIWSGPILASNRLIVAGSNGLVYSVSPYSGKILGKVKFSDGLQIAPIVAENKLYFTTVNAKLIAYK